MIEQSVIPGSNNASTMTSWRTWLYDAMRKRKTSSIVDPGGNSAFVIDCPRATRAMTSSKSSARPRTTDSKRAALLKCGSGATERCAAAKHKALMTAMQN